MDKLLYDVRKDGVKKANSIKLTEYDVKMLAETLGTMKAMSEICQNEDDILALMQVSDAVQIEGYPELQDFIGGVVDYMTTNMPQDILLETLTASYWNRNPQGSEALAFFIVIRSMLLIQEGIEPVYFEVLMDDYIPYRVKDIVVQQGKFVTKKMIKSRKDFLSSHHAVEEDDLFDMALDEDSRIRKEVFKR
ncbi:MAG: hypothetical protein K5851_03295 [Lachnospiraceae bacterium]|nr:hypothetical protein [Lachnospiraceae bacterium]